MAASLTSLSWIVFLPACLDISAAIFEILSAMSVSLSVNSSTASADTLFAPAFIRILATLAFGIVELFLPIKSPFSNNLTQHNRSEELHVPHCIVLVKLFLKGWEKTKKNPLAFVLPLSIMEVV